MQNKVTRDLTHSERSTEDKIKQFKLFITEKSEASEAKNETSVAILQHEQDEIKYKLSQVEVTEVILDFVRTEIRRVKMHM